MAFKKHDTEKYLLTLLVFLRTECNDPWQKSHHKDKYGME